MGLVIGHARAVASLAVLLLLPALAAGDSGGEAAATRADRWRALREAKRTQVAPPRAGFAERTLLAIEKAERPSILDFNVGGFHPWVQEIGWGSRIAGGTRFWQPDLGRSQVDVHGSALFSIRGYQYYELQAGLITPERRLPRRSTSGRGIYELGEVDVPSERFALYGAVRHRKLTALDFYGLGPDSRPEDRTNFLLRDTSTELVAGFRPVPRVALFSRAGYLKVDTGPGRDETLPSIETVFDDTAAPGLDQQPDFLYLGGTVLLEGRDEPSNPHRGAMLALYLTRFDARGGGDFDFWRLAADARAYVSLGSPARVLALRATALADEADDGSRAPFYLQEVLGGSHALRGFLSFRFRSERLAVAQVEYRWEAWPALELAVFWEGGAVRRADEPWSGSALETTYGMGVRLKTFETVFLRLDVARSDERTRVLLRFNPSY